MKTTILTAATFLIFGLAGAQTTQKSKTDTTTSYHNQTGTTHKKNAGSNNQRLPSDTVHSKKTYPNGGAGHSTHNNTNGNYKRTPSDTTTRRPQ